MRNETHLIIAEQYAAHAVNSGKESGRVGPVMVSPALASRLGGVEESRDIILDVLQEKHGDTLSWSRCTDKENGVDAIGETYEGFCFSFTKKA